MLNFESLMQMMRDKYEPSMIVQEIERLLADG